jgi:hypothetical protein
VEVLCATGKAAHLQQRAPVQSKRLGGVVAARECSSVVFYANEVCLLRWIIAWDKSKMLVAMFMYEVEVKMQGCAFTLGLNEPKLTDKPVLKY